MGFFDSVGSVTGGGGGGFVGGLGNQLFGGGASGGWAQQNGFLGGGANGNAFGMPDPLDIMGNRDKAQQKAAQDLYAQQSAKIDAQMKNRPGYADIQGADGKLDPKYAMQAASAGDATHLRMTDVNNALNGVSDVSNQQVYGNFGKVDASTINAPAAVNAGAAAQNAGSDLNRIRNDAFSTGPSAWANAANQQADLQTRGALDRMGEQNATARAQQESDLAMTGGLEGGARERIGRNAAKSQIMGAQDLYSQNMGNRNSIAMQDAQTKTQQQMQLPGMGLQVDAYNTGLANQNADRQQQTNIFNAQQTQGASAQNAANNLNARSIDAGNNMAAQQANNANDFNKANLYANVAGQNASADNAMAQYNATNRQNANQLNTGALIGDVRGQNAYNLDSWNTGMQVLGAQNTAQQMVNNMPQGGFFSKLLGGSNV